MVLLTHGSYKMIEYEKSWRGGYVAYERVYINASTYYRKRRADLDTDDQGTKF